MSIIQAILLGLLQGVAEFLPISSSGHLAVVQNLFSLDDVPLLFDVFLHLATLAAVVVFFRKKIWLLLCVLGRWISRRSRAGDAAGLQTIAALLLGTAVTGVFGVVLKDFIPDVPIKVVCAGFIVTAFVLILSAKLNAQRTLKKAAGGYGADDTGKAGKAVNSAEAYNADSAAEAYNADNSAEAPVSAAVRPVQGLLIGLAQGFGVLPGISRSGSTIAGALLCGVDRTTAGEFSFLLSIPAILGAFVLEAKDIGAVASSIGMGTVAVGCAAAFVSGFAALAFLMKIIRKGKLEWFAAYLIPIGILGIIFLH
ncbi:undecaprenyl-diphosphate phosphatase [Treponema brennaborense]|uniref:Undecaprenyl-diphosphatase n=1 Tax=Treponema brennaborense (strain DSM 12168 / CIP 105900 / DD5/3) TaxID=906968 RepID=F4LNF9_TREBD|nr:undecaprenyl-diphosphate phosphatase [Treponema brennaborense]AEE17917.1 Undecaprenyl-diphosphatase [Treponema brennaborense DSM 12168]